MNGPFVMLPMCDCRTDNTTMEKICTPFLRAFEYSCDGIKVIGDFDYDAQPYEPRGEVSSEAKCCDCCGGEVKATEVCYDLACLLRRRDELNGGLENISIVDGSGAPGSEEHFDPPVNSAEDIALHLNNIEYLGFTTWHESATQMGFLCVSVPAGSPLPGDAKGCRFRRFRTTSQNNGPSMLVTNSNFGAAYTNTGDSLAVGSPLANQQTLLSSNIHYLCKLGVTQNGGSQITVAEPFLSGTLQESNLYRSEFPDNSTSLYVSDFNTLPTWSDAWGSGENPNVLAGRLVWASALQNWSEYVLQSALTFPFGSTQSYAQFGAEVTNASYTLYPATLVVDVPCNIQLIDMYTLQINQTSSIEVNTDNTIPANTSTQHQLFFAEDIGVGDYTSTPYIDGVGGSVSWSNNCAISGPFDVQPGDGFDLGPV